VSTLVHAFVRDFTTFATCTGTEIKTKKLWVCASYFINYDYLKYHLMQLLFCYQGEGGIYRPRNINIVGFLLFI
jgi:hypothetical protein